MDTVYLDTETTGLYLESGDTIVEIGIVDNDGNVLVDTLINPGKPISHGASRVNGITDAMVNNAPSRGEVIPQVIEAVRGKTVVIYNAEFDVMFLPEIKNVANDIQCCMLKYTEYVGDWSDYHGNNRWHTLIDAAAEVRYKWPKKAHRAVDDALACRAVWRFLHM